MTDTATPITLPVIDISNPRDPTVGKAMLDAAAKYGFLYVNSRGTDFTVEDVDHAFGLVCGRDIHGYRSTIYSKSFKLTVLTVQEILCVARPGEGDLPDHPQCAFHPSSAVK